MSNWHKFLLYSTYAILVGMINMSDDLHAQSIDTVRLIELSPATGTAVINSDKNNRETVHIGDVIMNVFKLTEISEEHLVFDNIESKVGEKIIIRVENGNQKIERVTLSPETSTHYDVMINSSPKDGKTVPMKKQ